MASEILSETMVSRLCISCEVAPEMVVSGLSVSLGFIHGGFKLIFCKSVLCVYKEVAAICMLGMSRSVLMYFDFVCLIESLCSFGVFLALDLCYPVPYASSVCPIAHRDAKSVSWYVTHF